VRDHASRKQSLKPVCCVASKHYMHLRMEFVILRFKKKIMKRLLLLATIFLGLNAFGQFSAGNTYIDQTDTTICIGDSVQLNMFSGGTNTNSLGFIQGQYATIPNNGFFSTANQYTVEFWYKQTGSAGGDEHIFGMDWYGQKFYFGIGNAGNTLTFLRDQTYIPYLTGGWTHIAGVRDGSTIYLYIDGVLALSEPYAATSTPGSGNITINHHTWASGSSARLSGFFDELRVSDTVRYTSNFTPPANEFLNDANTIYLMHFNGDMTDELGNSGSTNGATWSNDTPFNTYAYSNASYLWSTGDTASSIYVQPAVTTTYYATIAGGSATFTDSVTITVSNPQVDAGTDVDICDGDSIALSGSGVNILAWSGGVTDGVAFTPSNSAYYYVTGTDSIGCQNNDSVFVNVLQHTSSSITETTCDTYTAPDGIVYTSSGIYTALIANAVTCDSIITIDLTVNSATASNISETALDSYTAPSGAVYTTNGVFNDTIPNAVGCDSVITITLMMNYTGIEELHQNENELIMIVDFMGRETEFKPNTPLIFIYSDGTRERVMKIEE